MSVLYAPCTHDCVFRVCVCVRFCVCVSCVCASGVSSVYHLCVYLVRVCVRCVSLWCASGACVFDMCRLSVFSQCICVYHVLCPLRLSSVYVVCVCLVCVSSVCVLHVSTWVSSFCVYICVILQIQIYRYIDVYISVSDMIHTSIYISYICINAWIYTRDIPAYHTFVLHIWHICMHIYQHQIWYINARAARTYSGTFAFIRMVRIYVSNVCKSTSIYTF